MALRGSLWRVVRSTVAGAAAGVAAFLAGFAATFVVQRDELTKQSSLVEAVASLLGPGLAEIVRNAADWLEPDAVEVVGWFFYASHYVDLEVTARALGQTLRRTVDLRQTSLWSAELAVVPPLLLALAGFAVAYSDRIPGGRPLETGVRVAVGYGATAVVGASIVTYTRDAGFASIVLGPDVATAGAFCAAYALVFATAGALVWARYEASEHRVELPN